MRINQIIAAVTRSLNITGVREILNADAFAHAPDLQLCMACVSPGIGMYSGPQRLLMQDQPSCGHPSHPTSHAWLASVVQTAVGKRKRLPLTVRLLAIAERGSAALRQRG